MTMEINDELLNTFIREQRQEKQKGNNSKKPMLQTIAANNNICHTFDEENNDVVFSGPITQRIGCGNLTAR
jgi:hypothetical protein